MTSKTLYFLITISVALFSSCRESGRAIEKRLSGINGPSIYYFDDSNNLINVQKEEYYKSSNYNVMIGKDTIRLGEEFFGLFFVNPNSRILITEPEMKVMESDSAKGYNDFRFTPKIVGLFNFKGTIEYDTSIVHFEYKFIVVPKK